MSNSKQKKPPRPASGDQPLREQVLICGLGLRLAHVTLETLQALRQCRIIFHDFLDKKTENYVRSLCPDVRDLRKIPRSGGLKTAVDAVLGAAAPGSTVAFLYYGHPMLFQEDLLISRCKAAGIPYRVQAALSSLDAVLAAVGIPLLSNGLQIFHADMVGRGAPLLLSAPALILSLDRLWAPRKSAATAFIKYLEEVYPPGHRAAFIHVAHLTAPSALYQETELRALGAVWKSWGKPPGRTLRCLSRLRTRRCKAL